MRLRHIDEAATVAVANMARDEALLLSESSAALRLYGWAPHAVSLGYFQRLADFADLPAGTQVVRRLTGGGAIHHGSEITYALALDAHLLPADVDQSYALMHDAIVRAVRAVGGDAHRLEHGPAPGARPHDRWCFAVPGRHDLVDAAGRKVCGSAQRRLRTPRGPRVLHHGSLVLHRPSLTPFVGAIADAVETSRHMELRERIAVELAACLSLELDRDDLTAAERALAASLQASRYENPAFAAMR